MPLLVEGLEDVLPLDPHVFRTSRDEIELKQRENEVSLRKFDF